MSTPSIPPHAYTQIPKADFTHSLIRMNVRKCTTRVVKLSLILTAVFLDKFYFCHFHSTACARRSAFICHITVFFFNRPSSPSPSVFPPFTPSSSLQGFIARPLPHLPNKVPTRNKASLFKGGTASKAFLASLSFFSFFFSFPTGSVCAPQPVGLCCPAFLSLDKFMALLWNLLK